MGGMANPHLAQCRHPALRLRLFDGVLKGTHTQHGGVKGELPAESTLRKKTPT
jgi:hypothetical protein